MYSVFLVFLGGGLGSLSRYGIARLLPDSTFPYGTLWANIISCVILGLLMGLSSKQLISNHHRLLLMTGFCGGFSTFSTFSGEIVILYQSGQLGSSLFYMVISLATGILSLIAGLALARFF